MTLISQFVSKLWCVMSPISWFVSKLWCVMPTIRWFFSKLWCVMSPTSWFVLFLDNFLGAEVQRSSGPRGKDIGKVLHWIGFTVYLAMDLFSQIILAGFSYCNHRYHQKNRIMFLVGYPSSGFRTLSWKDFLFSMIEPNIFIYLEIDIFKKFRKNHPT